MSAEDGKDRENLQAVNTTEAIAAPGDVVPAQTNVSEPESTEIISDPGKVAFGEYSAAPVDHGQGIVSEPGKASAVPVAAGPLEKAFNLLSFAGLPVLLILALLPSLYLLLGVPAPESFWGTSGVSTSEFIRQSALWNLLTADLVNDLSVSWQSLPGNPGIYYGLLYAVDQMLNLDTLLLLQAGAAFSGMLFIGAVWVLAWTSGQGRRAAFAAGLVALSCHCLLSLFQVAGANLFASAVLTLAMACFGRGWRKKSAPLCLTLAFLFTGLSVLCNGPYGLALVILVSVLFVFWLGVPGRLNGRDGLPGFLVMLLIPVLWGAWLLFRGQAEYLEQTVMPYVLRPLQGEGAVALPWWGYALTLTLTWLPWPLLLLFVNWWGVVRKVPAVWKTRRENSDGSWLWLTLLIGLVGLSLLPGKNPVWLLPLLAPLAVLTGRSLLRLSPGRSRCFFLTLALISILVGVVLNLLQFNQQILLFLPQAWTALLPEFLYDPLAVVDGVLFMGLILLLLGLVLLFLVQRALPGGALLAYSLGILVMFQFQAFMVVPSLQDFFPQADKAAAEQVLSPMDTNGADGVQPDSSLPDISEEPVNVESLPVPEEAEESAPFLSEPEPVPLPELMPADPTTPNGSDGSDDLVEPQPVQTI